MKTNVLWALTGRGSYAASQWLVMVLIAHLAGVHTLGNYSYSMALIAPVLMFSQLNMRAVQVVDVREETAFSTYLAARWTSTALAAVILAAMAWLNRADPELMWAMLALTCMKGAESVSDIYLGVLVRQENQRRIALSTLLRSATSIALVALCLLLADNLVLGLWLAAAGWMLQLALYDRHISARRAAVDYRQIAQLMWRSFPFGLVMALSTLFIYAPVYVTKSARGAADVGYLSSLLFFFSLGRMVLTTVTEVYLPRLAAAFQNGQYGELWRSVRHLFAVAMVWGAGGVAFVALFGDILLGICYGADFKGQAPALLWIMLAALISYISQIFFCLLTLARLAWEQFVLYIIATATCALAALWLVPAQGVLGAAKTLNIAMLVMTALLALVLRLKLPQLFVRRDLALKASG